MVKYLEERETSRGQGKTLSRGQGLLTRRIVEDRHRSERQEKRRTRILSL